METFFYPDETAWPDILRRPEMDQENLGALVRDIFNRIRLEGDKALLDYTERYDGYTPERLEISREEMEEALAKASVPLKNAMDTAMDNIRKFHKAQQGIEPVVETTPGVTCWRESRPIDSVGLYIPGGTAPLFSSVLMLAVPAAIAGCREVILCSPGDEKGKIAPEILYAAGLAGVQRIFRIGGAQAIAAMALGTETVPRVDKIFGPGNQYVTAAKQWAQQTGTAIDIPAGPSEVLVIADDSARPAWVAADLLSQAEHGPDSQVVLVTWSEKLAAEVEKAVKQQLKGLPRREIASRSLQHGKIILCRDDREAVKISNIYAPEHLILSVMQPEKMLRGIRHAGSVFLGHYTPESAGDYASGTNHTLPTNGYARVFGGVSLDSYLKKMTVQKITPEGLNNIGPAIMTMAEAEGLAGHAEAVRKRRNGEAMPVGRWERMK
ncbi:MAG TPA: histidinol dehydrogenase [Bacteroidetes bacterium]|nr:histidinol dehydrogenase [Bacteroidota bacterium]